MYPDRRILSRSSRAGLWAGFMEKISLRWADAAGMSLLLKDPTAL